MAGKKILPDVPRLLQLVDKGMTHQQIADMYGVTRQAVTLRLKGAMTPRNFRRDWPWDVQPRHKTGWLYDALSFLVISQTKERPLTESQRSRLSAFLDMLDRMPGDYVVDYEPESPNGLYLRLRRPDEDPESLLGSAAQAGVV